MSTDLSGTEKIPLPTGFEEWAQTYFGKKGKTPEPRLDLDAIFSNAYTRMRQSVDVQLHNASQDPLLKTTFETRLKTCDELESIPELQKLVSDVTGLLSDRRLAVDTKLGKLYDQTIRRP